MTSPDQYISFFSLSRDVAPVRTPILDDELTRETLTPHLQGLLPITRQFINAKPLRDALRPHYYKDIRYRPIEYPAPRPVQAPIRVPLPDLTPAEIVAPVLAPR